MVRISGLINTLNEADNIRYAVASLASWCDEVLVVDQMSDDDTVAIAERAGARVVQIPRTGYVEIIRKQSVDMTTGDWVFVLDADEVVHPKLATRLREIAERGEADVVKIPRRNIILGEWLKHGQWWPNDKRRFFHRDRIDVRAEMHGGFHCKPGARELILPPDPEACMWHFSYHTIEDTHRVNARLEEVLGLPRPVFEDICIAPEAPDQPAVYRKPSPRFILESIARHGLDPAQCWMVGDSAADLRSGLGANMWPNWLSTTSKDASGNGSASASPSRGGSAASDGSPKRRRNSSVVP